MSRRKGRGRALDGWLIVDKPSCLTSTTVVNQVRCAVEARKAGHGGTLDPLATGVLPIAFGAATKTVPYILDGTKLYRFTVRFGESRDTDDGDGHITGSSPKRPRDSEILEALPAFRGNIMQLPPLFSALKIAGERSYDLARQGRTPTLKARAARVDRFELIERPEADIATFEVECGKGVYMRGLARDLAVACGTLGHITGLRRLRVGPFGEAASISLDKVTGADNSQAAVPDLLLPVETALADIPALVLTGAEAISLSHGQALSLVSLTSRVPSSVDPDGGLVRAMAGGRVIGLCRIQAGRLRPERIL
jgi:tRNA pseudouridine55 synthase